MSSTATGRRKRSASTARVRSTLLWLGGGALLTLALVALLVRRRNAADMCFVLDVLGSRMPHPAPALRDAAARPPFAVGTLCFDETQRLAWWRLDESFSFAYGGDAALVDMSLHGPVADDDDGGAAPRAPVALAMGVHRGTKRRLEGSTVVDMDVLAAAVDRPERFYVSIYVDDERGTDSLEAGRSPLMRSQK